MLGTRAVDNCRGKTGTLHDVANLVGYCTARNGDTLAFAFMLNSLSNSTYGHLMEDQMGVALANYDGAPLTTTSPLTGSTGSSGGSGSDRRQRRDGHVALQAADPPASSARRPSSPITGTSSRSACDSFDPGLSPATRYDAPAGHRARHLAARGDDHLRRLFTRQLRQCAGQHERLAGQRALARRWPRLLQREPLSAEVVDQLPHLRIGQLSVDRLRHLRRRHPGVCSISSGSAASSASIVRNSGRGCAR